MESQVEIAREIETEKDRRRERERERERERDRRRKRQRQRETRGGREKGKERERQAKNVFQGNERINKIFLKACLWKYKPFFEKEAQPTYSLSTVYKINGRI